MSGDRGDDERPAGLGKVVAHVVDYKKIRVGYDLGSVDAAGHRDDRVGLPVDDERRHRHRTQLLAPWTRCEDGRELTGDTVGAVRPVVVGRRPQTGLLRVEVLRTRDDFPGTHRVLDDRVTARGREG